MEFGTHIIYNSNASQAEVFVAKMDANGDWQWQLVSPGYNALKGWWLLNEGTGTTCYDLAPFGFSVETYEFKGSFLSLAIDLPSEAAKGLTKTTFLKWKANCYWITQCLYSCD